MAGNDMDEDERVSLKSELLININAGEVQD